MKIRGGFASGIGSVLEWYDFSLYGFFAPLLAQLYFPCDNSAIALLKTFSVFAISFFARPIGALIFGYISDKYGRIVTLKITPLLITFPTLCFCFLPTYQQIGALAPLLLVFLRIWQGVCIGGEYANNIVYMCESARKNNLYFIGSLGSCTGSLGIMLASMVAALCYTIFTPEYLYSTGWRLAFAISLVIGVAAYLIRRNLSETVAFMTVRQKNFRDSNPVYESYKNQLNDYILSFGLIFLPATSFYYIFMFLPNFLAEITGHAFTSILGSNSLSLLMRLFVIPVIGILADKVGGINISRLACVLFLVLSIPLFYWIIHSSAYSTIFIFVFALLTTLNAAAVPGLLMELLKPETRCTIFSFTFNICFGVFGGITPVMCFFLINKIGCKMAPAYYLVFAAITTFISTFFFERRVYSHEK